MELIPATILTGFLGAGKTTLLQRVLHEAHGQKIAVIENEFGEESIDNELLISDTTEQIVQLNNGCICCSIREDLRSALSTLAQKKRTGELDFERIIIETTGMADPGPVAQTFFMDEEVANHYMLDSIITIVDAKHGPQTLSERVEAQRQVGFADQIFISKADLVTPQEVLDLQHRLMHMNPRASQKVVHFGEVPISEVLDLKGFNLNAQLEIAPDFLKETEKAHDHDGCGCGCHDEHHHHHEHAHEHGEDCCCSDEGHHHHHHHHDEVKSFVFHTTRAFDAEKLEDFLGTILQIYGPNMLRYKGILSFHGSQHKIVFQGVHQMMGSDMGPKWKDNEVRESKMVFIGIELPKEILLQGLEQCLV